MLTFALSRDQTRLGKKTIWNEETAKWEPFSHSLAGQSDFLVWLADGNEDTIENRLKLREYIADIPHASVVLGLPNTAQIEPTRVEENGTLRKFGVVHRSKRNFTDLPRSWLTVDVDGLPLERSVLENDDKLGEMFFNALADADLDRFIADCVIHLSSSHGIHDEDCMRAHVEWKLKRPLCLYEQKCVASHMNAQFQRAGYRADTLDEMIYEPSRLLFTTPPVFIVDGKETAGPKLQRIRIVRGNHQEVQPPYEWTQGYSPAVRDEEIRADGRVIVAWEPGHVNNAWNKTMFKAGLSWRPDYALEETAFRSAVEDCEAKIRGVPGSRNRTMERLREFQVGARRAWDAGVNAAKATYYGGPDNYVIEVNSVSLSEARIEVKEEIEEALADARVRRDKQERGDVIYNKPRCTIIKAPPGVGKTQGLISAIKELELENELKIDVRSPTISLSKQIFDDAQAELDCEITLYLGINEHCSPDMMPKVHNVLSVGVSPRKTVCKTCPFNEANGGSCKWPGIELHGRPGLRIGQHAHYHGQIANIEKGKSERIPDIYVIDESAAGELGPKKLSGYLPTLYELTDKLVLRAIGGKIDNGGTSDTRTDRKRLLRTLNGLSVNIVKTECFNDQKFIDDIIEGEEKIARQYHMRLVEMATGDNFNPKSEKVAELYAIKCSADLLYQVARAIKLSCQADSEYVNGLRLGDKGRVDVQIKPELPHPMHDRPIIVLDATPSQNGFLEKALFSATHDVKDQDGVTVSAPHAFITQYVDRSFSREFLLGGLDDNKSGDKRVLQYLEMDIFMNAAKHSNVLVIAQKEVVDVLKGRISRRAVSPNNVHFLHYKALKGINQFQNVPCVMIIGRHMPPVHVLEAQAEGLLAGTDTTIRKVDGPLVHTRQARLRRADIGDGYSWIYVKHESHPDRHVEAMRYQESDAEVIQAVGRVRPLQRTKDSPVHITVYGTTDIKLPIDEVRYWRDRCNVGKLHPYKEMIEEVGVAFSYDSPFQNLQFGGISQLFGREVCVRAGKTQRKGWSRWSLHYHGVAYKVALKYSKHNKSKQTPGYVANVVKEQTGITLTYRPRLLGHT